MPVSVATEDTNNLFGMGASNIYNRTTDTADDQSTFLMRE